MTLLDTYRDRVVSQTTSLFSHARDPLENTLDHLGDPGLFGPDSATWPILGDAAAFIGGIRALLIQAAHPEVAAGVANHSRYRQDPLGRLSRTSAYVTATSFGARPEVAGAVATVRRAHRPVEGESHRNKSYSASNPELAAWVHNVLTDSFVTAYEHFGPAPLERDTADRFVEEQTEVGRLLDADPLPATASDLDSWIVDHPAIGRSPGLEDAVSFLRRPPLPVPVRPAYAVMFAAAVSTIPETLRDLLGVRHVPGALKAGKTATSFLRWSLGSSPSWHIALVRVGAPIPPGTFRQPLPPRATELADRRRGRR